MAITKKSESTEKMLVLAIDNGDLQALKEAIEKFNFKDEQSALRFALFVLLKAEKNVVYVDQGEKKVILAPTEQLLKSNGQKTN